VKQQLDYLIFCGIALGVYFAVHGWIWRGRDGGRIPLLSTVLILVLLGTGWWWVETTGKSEMARIRALIEGPAPAYAREIERLGHEGVTWETREDDQNYRAIIEAQKLWLEVNPSISDIYTIRRGSDGRNVVVVDSETDYDRNGKFEGKREARTRIGEVFEQTEPALEAALNGFPGVTREVQSDRYGARITAFAPLHKADGTLDGVLGITYDASAWLSAVRVGRLKAMGVIALLTLFVLSVNGATSHQLSVREFEASHREQERLRALQLRFETLVNSIDGIVWESDARKLMFTFVSKQSGCILGYMPEQWMQEADFWRSKLHPDDLWAYDCSKKMTGRKEPYYLDYRMTASDGRTVWIRESAAPLLDEKGEATLVRGVFLDITEQKTAAEELDVLNKQLVESSRRAGMAEVATGVLHNVGNVLNSVSVSSTLIKERIQSSKIADLLQVTDLLRENDAHLPEFLGNDPRGKVVPTLIQRLVAALREEHDAIAREAALVLKNVGHIGDIVAMQQSYATVSGVSEKLPVEALVEDAIQINVASLTRHDIRIERDFADVPEVFADRHKVLQILVNLVRNAKQSLDPLNLDEKRLKLKVRATAANTVTISVIDNGAGIPPENLSRIFSHGFTTKKSGHGFGLHSSAIAAKEMGGSLRVQSEGVGLGASFTLELPIGKLSKSTTATPVAESRTK
jgi:PAS domain S-box-containing protein